MSHWLETADPADLTIVMSDGEIERIECRCASCESWRGPVHIPWSPGFGVGDIEVELDVDDRPPRFYTHTYTAFGYDLGREFDETFERVRRDMADAFDLDLARAFAGIVNDVGTDRHEPGSDGEVTLELGPAPASPGGMLDVIADLEADE